MSNFDKAFASARKGGKTTFSFGGKSYNTKLATDAPAKKKTSTSSSLPSSVSVPPKRPAMASRIDRSLENFGDGMAYSPKVPSTKVSPSVNNKPGSIGVKASAGAEFFPHKEVNNSRPKYKLPKIF